MDVYRWSHRWDPSITKVKSLVSVSVTYCATLAASNLPSNINIPNPKYSNNDTHIRDRHKFRPALFSRFNWSLLLSIYEGSVIQQSTPTGKCQSTITHHRAKDQALLSGWKKEEKVWQAIGQLGMTQLLSLSI